MKKVKNITLISLGLLLLIGWFYWFQWRPSSIRQRCSWVSFNSKKIEQSDEKSSIYDRLTTGLFDTVSYSEIRNNSPLFTSGMHFDKSKRYRKATEKEYQFCLHERGLK